MKKTVDPERAATYLEWIVTVALPLWFRAAGFSGMTSQLEGITKERLLDPDEITDIDIVITGLVEKFRAMAWPDDPTPNWAWKRRNLREAGLAEASEAILEVGDPRQYHLADKLGRLAIVLHAITWGRIFQQFIGSGTSAEAFHHASQSANLVTEETGRTVKDAFRALSSHA